MCIPKNYEKKTNVKLRTYKPCELAFVRTSLRLTAEDIGKILDCSKQTISNIETRRSYMRSPRLILYGIVLERICEERGTTFNEVLNSTEYFERSK